MLTDFTLLRVVATLSHGILTVSAGADSGRFVQQIPVKNETAISALDSLSTSFSAIPDASTLSDASRLESHPTAASSPSNLGLSIESSSIPLEVQTSGSPRRIVYTTSGEETPEDPSTTRSLSFYAFTGASPPESSVAILRSASLKTTSRLDPPSPDATAVIITAIAGSDPRFENSLSFSKVDTESKTTRSFPSLYLNSTGNSTIPDTSVPASSTTEWLPDPGWEIITVQPPTSTLSTLTISNTTPSSPGDECTPTEVATLTKWSIIQTSTVTWTGNPTDYTPPFTSITLPPEVLPITCPSTTSSSVPVCNGTSTPCDSTSVVWGTVPSLTPTSKQSTTPTIIIITTDKNPVVVFTNSDPPNYGVGATTHVNGHSSANDKPASTPEFVKVSTSIPQAVTKTQNGNGGHVTGAGAGGEAAGSQVNGGGGQTTGVQAAGGQIPASTGVVVVVKTSEVVIGGTTFTDSPRIKSSTVAVGSNTWTINPSQVVVAGTTVNRPSNIGGIFIPTPTTTTLGRLHVVFGQSVFSVDSTVFTAKSVPSTAVVKGTTFTIGPLGLAASGQTLPAISDPGSTETLVMGGELLTTIGQSIVVIEGKTSTYGPGQGSSTITQVVDGDTILIGPSGVIVDGSTLGGITAAPSATGFKMVGGATATQLGSTAVVIEGKTLSIGPGASEITTVIAGETLKIGENGIMSSTFTLAQPYQTTTTIFRPGETSVMASSTAEASENNAGSTLLPGWQGGLLVSSVALGAAFLGQLFYGL